jgi:aminopeptidase
MWRWGNAIRSASRRRGLAPEEVARRGGNTSAIHIDWMIGSGEIDIDGVAQDGSRVPVMRRGEWAE